MNQTTCNSRGALLDHEKYTLPFYAVKSRNYYCPRCEKRLIVSKARITFFKHYRKNNCDYYDESSRTNETMIHKDAKLFLKDLLESGKEIVFKRNTDCKCIVDSIVYQYRKEDMIELEYKVSTGQIDIAVLRDGEYILGIEVCHTHKTNKDRPEPWVEVKTKDIENLKNKLMSSPSEPIGIECSRYQICRNNCQGFNTQQLKAIELIFEGKNVFITGAGGTGKSHLIKYIHKRLGDNVELTSTTGMSAKEIGGITIDKSTLIGRDSTLDEDLKKLDSDSVRQKYDRFHTLLIDEISMMSKDMFDKLDFVCKKIRNRPEPFGGIQMIALGDFYQLKPVKGEYCFLSDNWFDTFPKENSIELTEIYRQKEKDFIDFLNDVRIGMSQYPKSRNYLFQFDKPIDMRDGIVPVKIYPKNKDIDTLNQEELLRLKSNGNDSKIYKPRYTKITVPIVGEDKYKLYRDTEMVTYLENLTSHSDFPDHWRKRMGKELQPLELCIGSPVILNKNQNDTLVNGSQGTVISFDPQGYPIVRFADKSGPETIKPVVVDFLYRDKKCRKCDDLPTHGQAGSNKPEYCQPHAPLDYIEQPHDGIYGYRIVHIPLKLGWAITIHSSQGQSLNKVQIDLTEAFEIGQPYVALSRVRSSDGLYVKLPSFGKLRQLCINDKVKKFYDELGC